MARFNRSLPAAVARIVADGLKAGEGPTATERATRRNADLAERRTLFIDAWGEAEGLERLSEYQQAVADREYSAYTRISSEAKRIIEGRAK